MLSRSIDVEKLDRNVVDLAYRVHNKRWASDSRRRDKILFFALV